MQANMSRLDGECTAQGSGNDRWGGPPSPAHLAFTPDPPPTQEGMQAELQSVTDKFFATRAELDMLQLQLNPLAASVGGAAAEQGATPGGGGGGRGAASNELLRTYLGRIADLEKEVGGGAGGGGGWQGGASPTWWRSCSSFLPPEPLSSFCPSALLLSLPSPIHPFLPNSPPGAQPAVTRAAGPFPPEGVPWGAPACRHDGEGGGEVVAARGGG